MVVLSLFDGMSCGQLALNRVGFHIDKYYASEIDKYAMQITQKNYPNTIQLGSVEGWKSWDIEQPDIIMGGSPCQGFSFAGKQLNFEDPRSKLFFTFVDIVNHYKPKYFLLENVKMKKEYQDIITQHMGIEPIEINSALVSAQNRKRLYWTNIGATKDLLDNLICGIEQPENKNIILKNILQTPGGCIKIDRKGKFKKNQDKASCLTGGHRGDGNHSDMDLIGQQIQRVGTALDINGHDLIKRIYSKYGKSPTLDSHSGGNRHIKIALNEYEYRRLTPIECERLQTVPDNYTEGVSNTQRYKMLGNGWTVDVIAHILKNIKEESDE